MQELGFLQPIAVRFLVEDDVYQIISGERRYRAAKRAGLAEMPCWVQDPEEEQVLLRQIVENWQRRDLAPLELADALAELRDAGGHSQTELARLTGKPKSEISKLLSLLELDPKVQNPVREGNSGLTKRHLYAISQVRPGEQPVVAEKVEREGLSAIETEKLVARRKQTVRSGRASTATIRRYATKQAIVTVKFRKGDVTAADVLAALDEARSMAEEQND